MARQEVEAEFPPQLIEGYAQFRDGRLREERERYEELAQHGQRPKVMVVSCCDSRAAPETVFNAAPGEMFVVRNVANLVPPYSPDGELHGTSAALEFAVQVLKVQHIVVMGHGRCGGVKAFREHLEGVEQVPLSPGDFIGKWMSLLAPAIDDMRRRGGDQTQDRQRALEEAAIRSSIANLKTFPCVHTLLEREQIMLHGAWFDIASGELWLMDEASGNFAPARAVTFGS